MKRLIPSGKTARIAGALSLAAVLGACSSPLTTIAPTPPAQYEALGKASGKACGSLGLVATAYYVVPMGLNSRVERAYAEALASVPGATSLINVSVREDWYWWVLGTARCVMVEGEAIR